VAGPQGCVVVGGGGWVGGGVGGFWWVVKGLGGWGGGLGCGGVVVFFLCGGVLGGVSKGVVSFTEIFGRRTGSHTGGAGGEFLPLLIKEGRERNKLRKRELVGRP